jgi:predicted nucleic-acid-binding Zn-ribbon protein
MEPNIKYNPDLACPKCGGQRFELAAIKLENTQYKPFVIKCFGCHSVLSVMPVAELREYDKIPLN